MVAHDPIWTYGESKVIESEEYWSYGESKYYGEPAVAGAKPGSGNVAAMKLLLGV